ncbi:MAG TPA: hypothetical protein VGH95_01880 [Candidatus Aquirickettsiella sp.]|jgi:hypothetical protein
MTEILAPKKELIDLSFEGECLETLRRFAYPSKSEDEKQVRNDLKRLYSLTIKNKTGEWSCKRPSEGSTIKTSGIEPDLDEVFFNMMESLNEKFKKFILSNFHQAEMLYGARQFLTLHLNAIGFIPSSTGGFEHGFTFDSTNSEELVVTENFSITVLDFISDGMSLFKVTT